MTAAVRAVVFDLDGTVVDSHRYTFDAIRHACAPWNVTPDDAAIHACFGPPENVILQRLLPPHAAAPAYARLQEYYAAHAHRVQCHPEWDALRARLHSRGVPAGLYTGRGMDSTRLLLTQLGLAGAFAAVVAGDRAEGGSGREPRDGLAPKPAPDGVLELALRLACPVAELLVVGDSPLDIEAARRAGAQALFAAWFPLAFVPPPPETEIAASPLAILA